MSYQLRLLPAAEWPRLAPLLYTLNSNPDHRCLHSDAGPTPTAYAEELAGLPPSEACYFVAEQQVTFVGAIGAQYALDHGRAWLRGPFVADLPGVDANQLRHQLFAALRDELHQRAGASSLRWLDAFPAVSNQTAIDYYQRAGFRAQSRHSIYVAPLQGTSTAWSAEVGPAQPDDLDAIAELHTSLFPAGPLRVEEVLAPKSSEQCLLAARRNGQFAGYLFASYHAAAEEGYVDFFGVVPEFRGQGLGRALLEAAKAWARRTHKARQMALTVREDREPARRLYESSGFVLEADGVHLRWGE